MFERITNFFLPIQCFCCHEFIDIQNNERKICLCSNCWQKINFISNCRCEICGAPLEFSHASCNECFNLGGDVRETRAAIVYNEIAQMLLTHFKHHDHIGLSSLLGGWLRNASHDLWQKVDLLVPVPLHRFRLFKRSYNQSMLICKALKAPMPICPHALKRIRYTPYQTKLSQTQRILNVKNAFTANAHCVKNKTIALVDDVMTTGGTLSACAQALYEAGAKHVVFFVVARALRKRS